MTLRLFLKDSTKQDAGGNPQPDVTLHGITLDDAARWAAARAVTFDARGQASNGQTVYGENYPFENVRSYELLAT